MKIVADHRHVERMKAVMLSLQLNFCTLTNAFIVTNSANVISRIQSLINLRCLIDSSSDCKGSVHRLNNRLFHPTKRNNVKLTV